MFNNTLTLSNNVADRFVRPHFTRPITRRGFVRFIGAIVTCPEIFTVFGVVAFYFHVWVTKIDLYDLSGFWVGDVNLKFLNVPAHGFVQGYFAPVVFRLVDVPLLAFTILQQFPQQRGLTVDGYFRIILFQSPIPRKVVLNSSVIFTPINPRAPMESL